MDSNTQNGPTHTEKMFILVNECADVIFDTVPVIMHSIDEDRIFLTVNPRWLSAIGYPADEIVGHQFTDFLAEEFRIQVLFDGLPLFWEAGLVHGASYRLSNDGRALYVALDAVVTPESEGSIRALWVFRKADDLVQWQRAKNAIKALQSLVLAQHGIERIFPATEWPSLPGQADALPSLDPQDQPDLPQPADQLPWELSAIILDIADSLKVLSDLSTDGAADPNSQPHSLVTLSEAFQTATA